MPGSDHRWCGTQGTSAGPNPLGKLPGSVWTVATEPLTVPDHLGVDHFAAFPTEFPRRIIAGWSPAGVCTACGEGRRPVAITELDESKPPARRNTFLPNVTKAGNGTNASGSPLWGQWTKRTITGYACACSAPTIPVEITEFNHVSETTVTRIIQQPDPAWVNPAPTTPAVILDPFGGTGTTALVAKALGRHGITVDLSADYCRLATWRTNDPDQLAKVLGIRRSDHARAADGLPMDSLFDLDGGGRL